jgi:hypothetical protein
MPQRRLISTWSGRIQDKSSQPIPQSRTVWNARAVVIDVLPNKVGDVAQLPEVPSGTTGHMRDMAMPLEPTGSVTLVLKPKLDDEGMNC